MSYFDDFLTVMAAGIGRFAPHVIQVRTGLRGDPGLPDLLGWCDVLIHSTGAEYLRAELAVRPESPSNTATPPTRITSGSEILPAIEAVRARHPQRSQAMKISDSNWFEVERYLRTDDRCVLPLGSTEQHAHLSLSVDSILSEKIAADAAEPLGVPVFPAVAYGLTPYFMAFPGTVSLRLTTYAALVRDILDSLHATGFRRVLIVNGHGGNSPVQPVCAEWMQAHEGARCRFHDWWRAPATWAEVQRIDPVASHASWMENFPWTRLPGRDLPQEQKPFVDFDRLRDRDAAGRARPDRGRQLRRRLSEARRGHRPALAGRGGGDARASGRRLGMRARTTRS